MLSKNYGIAGEEQADKTSPEMPATVVINGRLKRSAGKTDAIQTIKNQPTFVDWHFYGPSDRSRTCGLYVTEVTTLPRLMERDENFNVNKRSP